jgi:C4-type Zn-finger protein
MGSKANALGNRCKCGYRFTIRNNISARTQNRNMTCPKCGGREQPAGLFRLNHKTQNVPFWGIVGK